MPIAITFDYLCPFARIGHETAIKAVDGSPGTLEFRAFSLSQVHLHEGEPPVWEGGTPNSGVLALQWGLAVRDHFPERFADAHLALFSARHDAALDINDERVLRDAVARAGVDPDAVAEIVAGGGPLKALAADHNWAVERHRVFGVPTFISGDRAVFIRLMERPADAAEARRTFDRVVGLLQDWPELNEFKATKIPR
jgi:predicted DsbA family dithiol-disulfide isomerase